MVWGVFQLNKAYGIKQISGNYYIQDMETTNGTYVNGAYVAKGADVMLQSGDIILIADEEFEFRK